MQLVFADQPLPQRVTKSIFLAGPSIRSADQEDWRHDSLVVLETLKYDGIVLIPIPRAKFYGGEDTTEWSYDGQVRWEREAREFADCILFWIPRVIDRSRKDLGMPAFTTNVEFGADLATGKVVYGRPDSAIKNVYLDACAREAGIQVYASLEDTVRAAMAEVGEGAMRVEGEVHVPLSIWKTPQFQSWYADLKAAGNRLDSAQVLHQVRFSGKTVFAYLLKVNVWVESEQRHKANEFIFSRRDISAVLAYHVDEVTGETKVVLVREFRSPVSNRAGWVYELPGGSAPSPDVLPQACAQEELSEEIGLVIDDLDRFRLVGQRQLMATVSTHKASVFRVRLTDEELSRLEEQATRDASFGADGEERTYLAVLPLQNLASCPVDYATLGMVYEGLLLSNI